MPVQNRTLYHGVPQDLALGPLLPCIYLPATTLSIKPVLFVEDVSLLHIQNWSILKQYH
jgi:hypothetical protein